MGGKLAEPLFWGFAVVAGCALGAAGVIYGYWMLLPLAAVVLAVFTAVAWRRFGGSITAGDGPNVTPNLVLAAVPTVLGCATFSLSVGIWLSALMLVVAMWKKPPPDRQVKLAWPCFILPLAALGIIVRMNYPSTLLTAIFFALACVLVVRAVYLSTSVGSALVSLLDGVGLFLAVSVMLWFTGISGAQSRTGGLENELTGGERVVFPLSSSLAATPAMAAVYLAAAIPVLLVIRRHRIPRLVAGACAATVFALSDSRVSLLGALLLSVCVLLIPRLFRAAAPWVVGCALALPFVYGSIQDAVGRILSAASSYAPWLIRVDEEASSLNQRDYIWSQSLQFFTDRVDWVDQAIGFGSHGHAASGASAQYYRSFGGLGRDDRLMTPHNSALQLLFDGGWIIAGTIAVTTIYMAVVLSRRARTSPVPFVGLSMLVALSLMGITEVALSPGHAQPTWWILVALGVITFAQDDQPISPIESSQFVPSDKFGSLKAVVS